MELSQVMKEIRLVPEDRLPEIHDLIRSFIPGPETGRDDTAKIMRFAGCWRNLTDGEFAEFSQEIAARRARAFSGRIDRETVVD
uniref:Uncharacterized protein n=1 Tax=Candidatus Kentrum sp. SD TaxID=2126332 RepID=A0A451BNL6_9GAMM|nr:MAG: hypothetical protein BECKSD772D_GA0070982_10716 [Candidatus Kentron sp. SD]